MRLRIRQKRLRYFKHNWGAPFIIAFMLLLILSAVYLASGAEGVANEIAVYAYYSLVAGVALQIASYIKYPEAEEAEEELPAKVPLPKRAMSRRKKALLALMVMALLVGATAALLRYQSQLAPVLPHPSYPPLSASISFVRVIRQPDGTTTAAIGVSVIGGRTPYTFKAVWSDGFQQTNETGVFKRDFLNQTLPASVTITVRSSDGQAVNLTASLTSG